MRLLKVSSLTFEEFADERATPKYGILSHRWESQEVSYQDMVSGNAKKKKGYTKIKDFCNRCALDGLSHGWIDTCCIEKGSSAELSEAINSMYRWYQSAAKCYAFLSDVNLENSWPFHESEWFKRGWTLQELIAPNYVEFYDSNWKELGSKRQMADVVSDITKIPKNVLLGESPSEYSIAQRMSWAAKRTTTRIEDQAYSLMGLFDVNMPMLYGEGEKAFVRLQEEIIKYSGDQSIFAWPGILSDYDKAEMYDVIHEHRGGLLAKSPFAFALCGNIQPNETTEPQRPFALTNVGLSIELLLRPCSIDTYQAKLDCSVIQEHQLATSNISIYLRQTDHDGQYVREVVDGESTQLWYQNQMENRMVRVNVMQTPHTSLTRLCRPILRFTNSPIFESGQGDQPLANVLSYTEFNVQERSISLPRGFYGTVALLGVRGSKESSTGTLLRLGFDFDFNPKLYIELDPKNKPYLLPGDYASREWISSVSWSIAKYDKEVSRYVAHEEWDLSNVSTSWAYHGNRSTGVLVFIQSLNAIINIEKRDLIYERYWTVDIQKIFLNDQCPLNWDENFLKRIPRFKNVAQFLTVLPKDWAVKQVDRCPICLSFLHTPISTKCGHTFCQSCIDWADVSVVSSQLVDVPLEYNEFPTTDSRRNDLKILCPFCGSLTLVYCDSQLQHALQAKYPLMYRSVSLRPPGAVEFGGRDKNRSSSLETLTLLIGNTHKPTEKVLVPQAHPPHSLREIKHDWTFFVRPSSQEMVEEVIVHLHKSFRNPEISLRHSPFELRRWGWGYFTIFVEVILKPGYTILHDAARDSARGGHRNRLILEWELDFEDNGGQGKLRVKVQKHRSTLPEGDKSLIAQFSKIRKLQREAQRRRTSSDLREAEIDTAMSDSEL